MQQKLFINTVMNIFLFTSVLYGDIIAEVLLCYDWSFSSSANFLFYKNEVNKITKAQNHLNLGVN